MKIEINSDETEVNEERLSYDGIVRLAYPNAKTSGGCSVTYSRPIIFDGRSSRHSAILHPGESVEVADGLRIQAYWTGNG